MIIWHRITLKERVTRVARGRSVEMKIRVDTWFFVVIPIFRKETLVK